MLNKIPYSTQTLLFLAFLGLTTLWEPSLYMAVWNIRLDRNNATGRNEIRAAVGGLLLALSYSLFRARSDMHIRKGVLFTLATAVLGLGFGRVVNSIMEQHIGGWLEWSATLAEFLAGYGLYQEYLGA